MTIDAPSPAPDLTASAAAPLDPLESFAALMETHRQSLEASMGFWNAHPPRGHWRFLVSLGDRSPHSKDHKVAQITWDNPSAQLMACQALGLSERELPEWASAEGAISMLGLRFLFAASELVEGGWAETGGTRETPERPARETNTARAAMSPDADSEEAPLGSAQSAFLLKAWAERSGGAFRANGLEPTPPAQGAPAALALAELMVSPINLAEQPQRAFKEGPGASDLPTLHLTRADGSRYAAVADLRAAAREMGCPLELSLCAPDYKNLLCWDRIQSAMQTLNRDNPAEFEARYSDCLCPKAPGSDPMALLAARQEAAIIAASARRPAAVSRPRPL